MKLLIITNGNINRLPAFVKDQLDVLKRQKKLEIDIFYRTGHGVGGYIKNLRRLNKKIKEYQPDVIHAHYGLTGLLANFQRKVPVITTYHGSDIHSLGLNLMLSKISMRLSAFNIFVSSKLYNIAKYKNKNFDILPCGVDLDLFNQIDRDKAKTDIGWDLNKTYVLFSKSFDNYIKNYPLAKEAVSKLKDVVLVEFKGFQRDKAYLPMNAASCLLMTSLNEGSPQVIKEGMACGTPIVTVDVGDVREVIGDTEGCYICDYNADEIAEALKNAFEFKGKTNGRERIIQNGLSNEIVGKRLLAIYNKVIKGAEYDNKK